jgi:glycosyltransferase involved in cell wall biosynthesis
VDRVTNRWSSHVLAVSGSTAADLVRRVGVPADRVTSLPNGVDTARFRPAGPEEGAAARARLGAAPGRPLVAGLGRLHPQKNWPLFLEVAAAFPGADFVIAGTGPEEARLRAAAGANVRFAGFRDAREVLHAADVFLLTSDYEGMPMTLLEAMSCGEPPVVSAVDGCREILSDGAGGLLAQAGDAEDFRRNLAPLLASAAARASAGEAARAKVLRLYDARMQAAEVEALYLRLLAG